MRHYLAPFGRRPRAAVVFGLVCAGLLFFSAVDQAAAQGKPKKETSCNDGVDNDGDSLVDCFDADCYEDAACKSSGGLENTNERCSDTKDNDGDGYTDCEDYDCHRSVATVCQGSWDKQRRAAAAASAGKNGSKKPVQPALDKGQSVEDLVGKRGDKDGERNDYVCSDGIDNDGDGKIDCEDLGCKFGAGVTVCQDHLAGIRFSVAAHIAHSYDFKAPKGEEWDTRFSRIQLRAFGSIPGIQNSFFLLSIRAERSVRLTFATFEIPIWGGHRLNINSGGGGLSNGLVLGTQKNILLDPPFYLYSAFEGGNGAALEVNGPIIRGELEYRVFVAGGAGEFAGNVGGRFFAFDDFNYTWAVGAQLAFFPFGRFDRWDTRFLYIEVPMGLSVYLGGRYDQRAAERFPAANLAVLFRAWRFIGTVEGYVKRELEFKTWQFSYNIQAGMLIIPKWLMLAADFGQYLPEDIPNVPDQLEDQQDELQWRVALHLFVYKDRGVFTVLYKDRKVSNANNKGADLIERELRLEAQYRF
jgi:hypothetical protein